MVVVRSRNAGWGPNYHAVPMSSPRLSIVIPAWNQLDYTLACVSSLRDHTDVSYQLIIVDNGSEPETAAAARRMADDFVGNPENLGFAVAMNQGLAIARGDYVAFVNNDTVFPARWASMLVETLLATPNPGIVLPAVTAAGNAAAVREAPADRISEFSPFTAIPSGVVYLTERTAVTELGGWNEQYGIAGSEDLDLLFAFWANGRSVLLDERVLVEHASAVTSSTLPNRDALYRANRIAFARRWATASVADSPRVRSCSEAELVANLEKARIAATWMLRWFEAMDHTAEEARSVRRLERRLAQVNSRLGSSRRLSLPKRLLRRVKTRLAARR
jgi:GT2 family glycosyltransferase